jgi:methylenetetrahydrofolate--tRNA-(uracil-5-)-methyltransferase
MGNVATGLVAGLNAARFLNHLPLLEFPVESMTGALLHYITQASPADFQPMKANFGILPPLEIRPLAAATADMRWLNARSGPSILCLT